MRQKFRVAVLYGGRSGEHEVSLQSAASVIKNLDQDRFEIIPALIDKEGRWQYPEMLRFDGMKPSKALDVVFPVMHGTFCEDGTIQGLLELADVPYVGCGVLASAVGMDKDVTKRLIRDAGLPIVPYLAVKSTQWRKEKNEIATKISRELGFPVFVKPANAGSSVGVHKVKEAGQLSVALNDSFLYDTKVLIEKAIPAREIELAVLEHENSGEVPRVSAPGEVVPHHEFYSYEAKYLDENGAALLIPAQLDPSQTAEAQRIAREAFMALECEGMARADLFLDKNTGEFYFNEVNTIPGFTSISMYPKMWEASGIPYRDLLTRLIDLAIARHKRKKALKRSYG